MSAYANEMPIVKDVQEVGEGFSQGLSFSTFTAATNIGVSALGAVLDPVAWVVGQLMEPIYNWIINNVTFIKDTLNSLLGNPEEIAATGSCAAQHGARVGEQASNASAIADRLQQEWEGVAATAALVVLRLWSGLQETLAEILKGCGVGIQAVASVVDMIKQFLIGLGKDLINELISKAVMSVLASFVTFGAALAAYTAWAAGKVAAVGAKFTGLLKKLADWGAKNARQGSQLQKALEWAATKLGRMQAGFLSQVHQADQAAGAASQAQVEAAQANSYNSAAQAPSSDGAHYAQQQATHAQNAQDLTQQSNTTRPDVGPDRVDTVGVDAVNSAAQNEDDRADNR